ncbi:hemicentin-1-like isoform X2 [Apostichopus japonicus]|uniref:hemicentin-1-like isoform X2 n=1 Tax=Stichopus japonicus TaxID=307972 RepID=UPI003AB8F3D5
MNIMFFRFSLSFLLLPAVVGLIQFTQEPSSMIARLSESIWWHCTARLVGSNTALSYSWFKGDQPIIINSNTELFQNGTFHIREVRRVDSGSYHCRAQGGGEIAYSESSTLSIAELAASFSINPQSMSINLGSPMSLLCAIESNPQATITWLMDGSPYQGSGVTIATNVVDMETQSTLNVAVVEHRHSGQYTCTASNPLLAGEMRLSDSATLTLIGRPGFMTSPSPQVALVGSSVTFQCTTSGSPAATIVWQNENEETISNSQRVLVSTNSLRITDVRLSDGGYYTCKAFNEYGENKASALLTVTDSFVPVAFTRTPVDQTVVVGGRVTFACEATGTPEPTLTWTKENGDLSIVSLRTDEPAPGWLRISNVEVSDSGLFMCTASNGLSTSSTSVQLTVQEGPYFLSEPVAITVREDEFAMLDCTAGGVPEPEISWTTPISSLGTLQTPSNPSSMIEVAGNGSLTISSVSREHAGRYTCSARNAIGSIHSDVTITVHARPVITIAPQDMTAVEGDTVMLTCRASATPPVIEVKWMYQSEQLFTNLKYEVFGNGNLRINNIEKPQEGRYSCQAENDVGSSEAASSYVTVQVPPEVEVFPVEVTLDLGSNVVLHCSASGDPTPTLEWEKDDKELVLTDNVKILTNFSLEIRNFRRENAGSYQCMARNDAGNAQGTAVVMATDIPEFTSPNDNITANQSQPAVLPCRAAARETPAISWYLSDGSGVRGEEIGLGENVPIVRGFQSTVTDEGDLSFSVVSRDDEGWFICEAVNSIGSVEMTVYLTVNYPPSITTSTWQITGEGLSLRAILKCDTDGEPFPSVSWYFPSGELVEPMDDKYYLDVVGVSSYFVIYTPEVALHDGDFRCKAENILGSVESFLTVTIEGIPVIVEVSAVPATSTVTLRCLSKGAPSPLIVWYANDVAANNVPNHSVQRDGGLVVRGLDVAERGRYRCFLQNKYGSVSAFLQAPGSPFTPEVNSLTSKTIDIFWLAPESTSNLTVSSYLIEYIQFAGNGTTLTAGTTEKTSRTIQDLAPYTGYQFRVSARNGLGVSQFSDFSPVIFTAEDVPDAVENLETRVIGNSILISWAEPQNVNGNAVNIVYEIQYGRINDSFADHVTLSKAYNDDMAELLADLQPSVLYRIALRVVNTKLKLESTDTITEVKTGYPVPVVVLQDVQVLPAGSDSILVMWRAISPPDFLRYILSFRDSTAGGDFVEIFVYNPADQYLIRSLNPANEYEVKMSYETESGIAPYTSVVTVNTEKVSIDASIQPQRRSLSVGVIIGVVFGGLLLVVLVLLFLVLFRRWKQPKDQFTPSPGFDPDSLWINRRGSEKKGTYEVAIVNENYDPGDTLMSNDSAYDLAKTEVTEARAGSHLMSEGIKSEKKKKKKKKRNDDLIYKDPMNPDVVLVKKAVLGEDSDPPRPVRRKDIISDHQQDDETPNTTLDLTDPDSTKDSTLDGDFPIYPNADTSIILAGDVVVVKDNTKQEKVNKKARQKKKRQEKQEQKERDRDFDIGYRHKISVTDMFNLPGRFSRRRKSSLDEIPYPEEDVAGPSRAKHGESAVLY